MAQPANALEPRNERRCLLVEDTDFDRKRIRRIMSRSIPMEVTIAQTLGQALQQIKTQKFDLVLLDNAMPDGLGIDFISIHGRTTLKGTPVIMISDWPTPFMYDKAMAAGVSSVLSKDDFEPRHIRDALRYAKVMAASKQ